MTAASPPLADSRAIEALLAFWADSGVDACLGEAPSDRLAARAPPPPLQIPLTVTAPPVHRPAAGSAAGGDHEGEAVAHARAAAACADLDALAAAARGAFPGAAVLWEGVAPARLVVIGDAPTAEDEATGRPFSGARGALVRGLLRAAGLDGEALFLNTVFRRGHGGADPAPAAQALAAPFVTRALALARPRAALLLGACAVRGATGVEGPILKLRGGWLEGPQGADGEAIPALATLGPDFLMKHPAAKKQAWGDVLSLAARLGEAAGGD